MSSHVQNCDFVLNIEIFILYIYLYFVFVEDPKADELSLLGFTIVNRAIIIIIIIF